MYVNDIATYFGVSSRTAAVLLYREVFGETRDAMCASREAVVRRDETPLPTDEVAWLFGVTKDSITNWLNSGCLEGERVDGSTWGVRFRAVLELLGEHYGAELVSKAHVERRGIQDQVLESGNKWAYIFTPTKGKRMYVLRDGSLLKDTSVKRKIQSQVLEVVLAKLREEYETSEKFIEGFVEFQGRNFGEYLLTLFKNYRVYHELAKNLRFICRSLEAHYWVKIVRMGSRQFYCLAETLPVRIDPERLDRDFTTDQETLVADLSRLCLVLRDKLLEGNSPCTNQQLVRRLSPLMRASLLDAEINSERYDQGGLMLSMAEAAASEAAIGQSE